MTVKDRFRPFAGAISVFLGAVFFSGKAILVKIGIHEGATILTLLNLRMLFALPFFIIMAFWGKNRNERKPNLKAKDLASIIFLGIIGYYLASYFDFVGLQYISAGLERLIIFMYPTLVVIISAIVFRTKVMIKEVIAIGLTYIGILFAFISDAPELNSEIVKGAIFVFFSALTYAIYLIGSGKLIPKVGASKFTGFAMIVSTLAVLLHSIILNELQLITTTKIYILGFLMAILCTVVPSILLAQGIKLIGSGRASIIGSIGPVSTILLAFFFLGEDITLAQISGTFLVIFGVLLVSRQKTEKVAIKQ